MATVAAMPHTAVLAVSQLLERAQQPHLPHCRRRPHCRLRLHCRRRPHQALLLHPLVLQSVQMEPVEVQRVTRVKDPHME